MQRNTVYFWKQFPFVRFLVPLVGGILVQWYLQPGLNTAIFLAVVSLTFLFLFPLFSSRLRFLLKWVQGISIQALFFVLGCFIVYNADVRHHEKWVGNHYKDSSAIIVTLLEPLVEKSKSYKALAALEAVQVKGSWERVEGKLLVYIKKDSLPNLAYGSQLLLTKPLQNIKNSGNPGAFNYQRYCAFQDIYHQVFLKQDEFVLLPATENNRFQQRLFDIRFYVINTLKRYIHPAREAGVAEALLIGYRDDLDKDLVQAYSNTGVVHIIAISGLHLGLIYGVLVWLFSRFKRTRTIKWLKPLTILFVLWIFTLVAGAAPSIVRSAVMFTCIVLAEVIDRRSSIYNTLAVSAFIMLCYNPFFLWDVGFQLSYAAVLSIIAFMKPVYNWFYFTNKIIDTLWKLNAVTISAQILTLPLILYYFHQFPNLFLITNFVAVPLSGFILYGELLLLAFSFFSWASIILGKACSFMLWVMNSFIERTNEIPFAITNNIQVTLIQSILLFVALTALCFWLLRKNKTAFFTSLAAFTFIVALQSFARQKYSSQKKVIVYNIPQHTAIDFINGTGYNFVGDTAIISDNFLNNFHLKPSRSMHQVELTSKMNEVAFEYPFIEFSGKRILLLDKPFKFATDTKIKLDAIVISKNAKIYINDLAKAFDCNQYVFDASNPTWKINLWKKDCDNLHLRHHSTAEKGAFEMKL
jgi:competence protein ComEC